MPKKTADGLSRWYQVGMTRNLDIHDEMTVHCVTKELKDTM